MKLNENDLNFTQYDTKKIFKNVPQRLVNEQKAVYGLRTAT